MDDALLACRAIGARGRASAVGFWNQAADEPRQVADNYLAAAEALSRSGLDSYLSIKAPALGFSPELVAELLQRTRSAGVHVHFDSLSPESAERTLALVAAATQHDDELGITLPAGWRRSLGDAGAAVELGLGVRVVKGQWPDLETPDPNPRAGFMAIVERLAGRARRVAVATHDEALAREALQRLRAAGTPCELELLFGLPAMPAAGAADELSAPVRIYVPYGHTTLPYRILGARRDARAWAGSCRTCCEAGARAGGSCRTLVPTPPAAGGRRCAGATAVRRRTSHEGRQVAGSAAALTGHRDGFGRGAEG